MNNLVWDNNDFSYIQRIPFETQSNWYSTAFPTLEYIEYNSLGNRYNGSGGQQNFDFSIANGCGNPPATAACTAIMLGNVDIQNVNNSTHGAGNEFWGDSNSSGNYNLFEGYVAGAGGAIDWAQSGAFNFNNNTFNIFSGSGRSTNCQSPNGGYWNNEDSPASLPTCSTGNSYSSTGSGAYTIFHHASLQPFVDHPPYNTVSDPFVEGLSKLRVWNRVIESKYLRMSTSRTQRNPRVIKPVRNTCSA